MVAVPPRTQKTLQESAPFSSTTVPPVVTSEVAVLGAWKIQTELESPWPFRVRTPPESVKVVDAAVYTPATSVWLSRAVNMEAAEYPFAWTIAPERLVSAVVTVGEPTP
jgi:hypothetical protein